MSDKFSIQEPLRDIQDEFRQAFSKRFGIRRNGDNLDLMRILGIHRDALTLYGSQVQVMPRETPTTEKHCTKAWLEEMYKAHFGVS